MRSAYLLVVHPLCRRTEWHRPGLALQVVAAHNTRVARARKRVCRRHCRRAVYGRNELFFAVVCSEMAWCPMPVRVGKAARDIGLVVN